ncbi:MAG: hypothetical protein ACI8T1_004094 [Verrucomicrobiales bacterium]|jgi:hypothetical protein
MKPNDKTFFERSIESESPPMRPWFEVDWATERDLIFAVGCPNKPHNPRADAHPDTFTSGLWQHDVGELFIKHAEDDRYLEINLGPRGSWWACLLGCYRQPAGDPEQAPFVPKSIASEITETSWETRLTIPAEFLQTALQLGATSRVNVCFILGPADARHHFSWAPLPHDPPDFHHVEDFVPLC